MKLLSIESSSKWTDIGLLLLRITFGAAMLYGHGMSKWGRLFSGEEIQFADPFGLGVVASLGLAVFAEVICSILVMLGLFTRLALLPLLVTMAVAFFMVHISDEFAKQEKAILYGITYLALFFTGPGHLSLDAILFNKQ